MRKQVIELPRLTDSQEYVLADAKLTELRLQLVEAEKKTSSHLSDLMLQNRPATPSKEAAQRMLEGDTSPVTKP